MTKEQKQLKNITSIVKEAYDKVNENNGYYVVDVSHLIEELAVELELDKTFDETEIKILKKSKFNILKNKKMATKKFKTIPIEIEKTDFSEYIFTIGRGWSAVEELIHDLDSIKTTSETFKEAMDEYKLGLK